MKKEIQDRLAELLQDFAGGDVSTYDDEGIDGEGLVLRILSADRMIEVNLSVSDVTDDLSTAAQLGLARRFQKVYDD